MDFLKTYNDNVVKYDLINKFSYHQIKNIPNLEFITLNVNFKKTDFKLLISTLAALELLTLTKGRLIKSKSSNISFKIRKGQPVGCKIILRKKKKNLFLYKLINLIIQTSTLKTIKSFNLFSIKIDNILIFKEIEQNYQFFKSLSGFNIYIKTTTCTVNEFVFLLNSFKL